MLSKRPYMHLRDGEVVGLNSKAIAYAVDGLPSGQRAWIAEMGRGKWQILRAIGNAQGPWEGHYQTADEALKHLEKLLKEK